MPEPRIQAIEFARQNQDRFLNELNTFLAIPSISTDPERKGDILKAANHLVDALNKLSFDKAAVYETKRHPVVFGEKRCGRSDAKTVLIYGHYDVQPADPLDLWKSEPFTPQIREEYLYARGASDMKGQIWAALESTGIDPIHWSFTC